MVLIGMMAVQLIQDLDDIGVRIRPTESIPSTIKAENKLVWLFRLFNLDCHFGFVW